MEEKLKEKRDGLVGGLKHYFNGDMLKVKRFANSLKMLGFDLNDIETLEALELRSEAMVVLLGLFNFGVLTTVTKSILHLRGGGNPDDYIKQYVEKFERIPPPK